MKDIEVKCISVYGRSNILFVGEGEYAECQDLELRTSSCYIGTY
jgi:hypothetical protein